MDTSKMLRFYRDHMNAMTDEHESEHSEKFIKTITDAYAEWSEEELMHHAIDIMCLCFERSPVQTMHLNDEIGQKFNSVIMETIGMSILARARHRKSEE